ncbi:polysaccharide biosynthesis protein [Candidatus Venteria ishoeyi]|uniref:UDP-N-acetylglucosamine 4,6-dehydratase (Inverting) n=1 Tax=Candidatus Venteria ishoeyi TaxID=1899563 RepID=A0A1H6FGX8_9GAMM|nr:polysaccharide biosynthesis protein [Candidatus Venteria ishoeyi]SEH08285.1 UDP-N-acetylglucosamine 4%2C6-dehydratase (inverting) [Candidatus Venteria ishoeyi]
MFFSEKVVLVTGCCGTVGSELVKQLIDEYKVERLIGIDNNESDLFFQKQYYNNYANVEFYIADIRDRDRLLHLFFDVDIIFHAAALKHVALCEHSPFEAVQTNIIGVRNVIDAASDCNVERVIFTSSDKAVNSSNVMGTSKLMGERLMTAASSSKKHKGGKRTIFASTRFGNVLGSRGSVIPIFYEQIKCSDSLTLTDIDMTRFIMSIAQAVHLVIDSCQLAQGGEVFVTKMPVIRITDLAEVMIQQLSPKFGRTPGDIKTKIIGIKPGEKLYEELMSTEEIRRTYELEHYFVVLPAYLNAEEKKEYQYNDIISYQLEKPYNSENETALSQKQLGEFLISNKLLEI